MKKNYAAMKSEYKAFVEMTPDQDALSQIERDLGRNFPSNSYLKEDVGGRGH